MHFYGEGGILFFHTERKIEKLWTTTGTNENVHHHPDDRGYSLGAATDSDGPRRRGEGANGDGVYRPDTHDRRACVLLHAGE